MTKGEPRRVQLQRTKGWKMPANTVSVARPGRWGNPWRVANESCWGNGWVVLDPPWQKPISRRHYCEDGKQEAAALAVQAFRDWMASGFGIDASGLRGKNLACWCALDQPCHADVLLEIANRD